MASSRIMDKNSQKQLLKKRMKETRILTLLPNINRWNKNRCNFSHICGNWNHFEQVSSFCHHITIRSNKKRFRVLLIQRDFSVTPISLPSVNMTLNLNWNKTSTYGYGDSNYSLLSPLSGDPFIIFFHFWTQSMGALWGRLMKKCYGQASNQWMAYG